MDIGSIFMFHSQRIEDLSIKCTDLSNYRTDAEHKINELSKAEEEKETLRKDLAR